MNRFEYALQTATAPHMEPLATLAHNFYAAITHCAIEGEDPAQDPAVIVLGSFIAFHVHADVNTRLGYSQLLTDCETRRLEAPEIQ